MKAWRGSRDTAPLTLNLSTRRERSASRHGRHTPWEEPRYPLKRNLCGPGRRSGGFGENKKKLFLWPGFEPWVVQSVDQSLYQQSCPGLKVSSYCEKTSAQTPMDQYIWWFLMRFENLQWYIGYFDSSVCHKGVWRFRKIEKSDY